MDDRARVVKEILESERKYVQDLEVLQREILPSDQIRALFINLDSLVDFQRRFLIGVEANARLPPDEQRFGHLFHPSKTPSPATNPSALISPRLKVADILDPNYELPTFLIKPVQRICKYPLLLQQLVKHTNSAGPYFNELKEGLASITRVTDAVNETTRQRENELAVNDLKERVEDWKGHELVTFGQLVLEDTFTVVKNDSERNTMCISLRDHSLLGKNTQQLKGRIFIANVMSATPRPVPPGSPHHHQYLLQVTWRGDISEEYFSIKCRTEEQLKKWQAAITKAVDDAPAVAVPQHTAVEMGQPPNSASYPHHSISHPPRIPEHPYAHSGHGNGGGSMSSRTFEDEEESYQTDVESSVNGRNTPSGSRRTAGHRSMPAERSESSFGPGRARAQTDDAASANMAQWRNQMPTGSIPPVPRSGQLTPASSDAYMTTNSLRSSTSSKPLRQQPSHEWGGGGLNGGDRPRPPCGRGPSGHPFLNRHHDPPLPPSHPLPPPPPPPHQQASQSSSGSGSTAPMFRSRSASSPNIHQPLDFAAHHHHHHQWQPGHVNGVPSVPSLPPVGSHHPSSSSSTKATPLQNAIHMGHMKQRSSDSSAAAMTDRSSMDSQRLSGGANSSTMGGRSNASLSHPMTLPAHVSSSAGGSVSGGGVGLNPRFSSGQAGTTASGGSSLITSRSSGSLVVVQGGTELGGVRYGEGSSMAVGSSSSGGGAGGSTSIRFKLRAGEDTYVIVTLSSVTYQELIEKIYKKLRNCGVAKSSSAKLKIRYEDEEGDLILICNDEDVAMAIEWMRSVGISHLLLFVD
ncbi:hypothetical protein PCASD_10540 [Puccinia coronata f. sp. avenae]|uniref:DH domain-containing protein n=1 Tax=Puccinia coronata f. sp. avenae TaxID=200324 RepID=A0A2N5TC75_9BASI|nr:hypothetical protein PCASD_10540 [Puccinia coronata f. sp. avenae]